MSKITTIKIPVIVREDGATFVFERDSTWEKQQGIPSMAAGPFPGYTDLDGLDTVGRHGGMGRQGNSHLVWVDAILPVPESSTVRGTVEDAPVSCEVAVKWGVRQVSTGLFVDSRHRLSSHGPKSLRWKRKDIADAVADMMSNEIGSLCKAAVLPSGGTTNSELQDVADRMDDDLIRGAGK